VFSDDLLLIILIRDLVLLGIQQQSIIIEQEIF